MADMRKVEEENAVSEKRKLDLPGFIHGTFGQTDETKEAESESSKRQKLEMSSENEINVVRFHISGKKEEAKEGIVDFKADEEDCKEKHVMVEAETAGRGTRYSAAEKGKTILIEESEESSYDDEDYTSEDDDSSEDSDSDSSNGLDSGSEDIPF